MIAPTLRPYQLDAGAAVEAHLLDKGQNRLLVKKPTGTGKTVWFAALLRAFPRLLAWLEQFPKGERKMLVIAHREELLQQAAEKIRTANPGLMVSIEQGELHANRYSDVVVASIQTLAAMKFRRLKRLLQHHTFRLVVVDEAHHAAAATYRTALVHLGFLPPADASDDVEIEAPTHEDVAQMTAALEHWDNIAPRDRLLLGVTATPNRSDAIGLGCVFQSIAYSYGLKQAIADGYLVPILPWVVETSVSLDQVKTHHGDFNQRQLADAVNNPERNRLAVDAWRKYGETEPTLVFSVDVAHAHALADEFRGQGFEFEAVSGETEKFRRRDILDDYRKGNLQGVVNCMVLTEGTDLPLTGCILQAKPTKSPTLYEQIIGRGLRVHPDDPAGPARAAARLETLKKTKCIVIDMVDVARRHSLQTAPVLYGLPPGLDAKGKKLEQLEADLEALREKYPQLDVDDAIAAGKRTLDQLAVHASTFDIWSVPEMGSYGIGLTMQWMRFGDDTFRLQYPWNEGIETLTVQRDILGHFDLSATFRANAKGAVPRQRTMAAQVTTAQAALQLAEAFVLQERRSVMRIADREAPWRTRKASQKQIDLLLKWRVPFDSRTITSGQASDLITLAQQRRGR